MYRHNRLQLFALPLVVACLSFGAAASASAQYRHPSASGPESGQRVAYDNGYSVGREHGELDAREGRDFNFAHHPDYQRVDIGYNRDRGDLESYRRVFRQGYAMGYEDGYHRLAGYPGSTPPRHGYAGAYGDVRETRWPPSFDIAYEYGFADGFKEGREDARDNDRYDPVDHGDYRDADRGYESEYGARETYKAVYREGFREGYTRGYREGRY